MKENDIENKTKVSEWIRLLESVRQLFGQVGQNEDLARSLEDLTVALKPYEKCQYNTVITLLKQQVKDNQKLSVKPSILDSIDLESISLNELRKILSEELNKNELLLVAGKTLNMPVGTLKKLKKIVIKQKILNVIQNSEKLDTIAKQAAGT